MELRKKQVGYCSLYEGADGRWNRASFGKRSSRAFTLMLLGECEPEDYMAELRAEHEEYSECFRLMGRPARGPIGRYLLRRHLAAGKSVTCKE